MSSKALSSYKNTPSQDLDDNNNTTKPAPWEFSTHLIQHPSTQAKPRHINNNSQPLVEVERIPAQRARAGIAGLEPLEQTAGVEHVLARRAALLRQLAVAADDAVADGALGLALHGARDVAAERGQAVGDGAVLSSCQ